MLHRVTHSVLTLDAMAGEIGIGQAVGNLMRYLATYPTTYGFIHIDAKDKAVRCGVLPALKLSFHNCIIDIDATLIHTFVDSIRRSLPNLNTKDGKLYTAPLPSAVSDAELLSITPFFGVNHLVGMYTDETETTVMPILVESCDAMISTK